MGIIKSIYKEYRLDLDLWEEKKIIFRLYPFCEV